MNSHPLKFSTFWPGVIKIMLSLQKVFFHGVHMPALIATSNSTTQYLKVEERESQHPKSEITCQSIPHPLFKARFLSFRSQEKFHPPTRERTCCSSSVLNSTPILTLVTFYSIDNNSSCLLSLCLLYGWHI